MKSQSPSEISSAYRARIVVANAIERSPTATPDAEYMAAVNRGLTAGMGSDGGNFRQRGDLRSETGSLSAEPGRIRAEMQLIRDQTSELVTGGRTDSVTLAAFTGARIAAVAPFERKNGETAWALVASSLCANGENGRQLNFTQPPSALVIREAFTEASETNNLRPIVNAIHTQMDRPELISNEPIPSPFRIAATLARPNEPEQSREFELNRSRRAVDSSTAPEPKPIAINFFAQGPVRPAISPVVTKEAPAAPGLAEPAYSPAPGTPDIDVVYVR